MQYCPWNINAHDLEYSHSTVQFSDTDLRLDVALSHTDCSSDSQLWLSTIIVTTIIIVVVIGLVLAVVKHVNKLIELNWITICVVGIIIVIFQLLLSSSVLHW
jgi:hypothetical protein